MHFFRLRSFRADAACSALFNWRIYEIHQGVCKEAGERAGRKDLPTESSKYIEADRRADVHAKDSADDRKKDRRYI